MKPYRCQICGEVYLGELTPDRCPFCGVLGNYLHSAPEYITYGEVDLSQNSREFCRQAIELEANNVAYYRCAARSQDDPVRAAIFKRAAKHEAEHLELIAEMAGIEEEPHIEEECGDDTRENMESALKRENWAVKLYTRFARQAPEGRMREVFRALADVEMEHYKMFNLYR